MKIMWNLKFDFLTIQNRLRLEYGIDPVSIMVPEELRDVGKLYYHEDTYNADWADKTDSVTITSPIVYNDQLLTFASFRKTMGKRDSYRLEDILQEECGFSKLDLGTDRLKDVPYKNFYKFAHYSLRDTLSLKNLEFKVKDLDQLYGLAVQTRTRLEKAFTKTICLRNYSFEVRKETEILTSNPNRGSLPGEPPTPKMKFVGAVVADPKLVEEIYSEAVGMNSRYIFDNNVDFDYTSLHPSIMRTFQIDYQCFVGTIDIDINSADYDPENPQRHTIKLVEDAISDDLVGVANEYFGLPNLMQMEEAFQNGEFGDE